MVAMSMEDLLVGEGVFAAFRAREDVVDFQQVSMCRLTSLHEPFRWNPAFLDVQRMMHPIDRHRRQH